MGVLWELAVPKTLPYLIMPPILAINDIRKDAMSHHNEVDGTAKSKKIRLEVCVERVGPGAEEPAWLGTAAFQKDLSLLRQDISLETASFRWRFSSSKRFVG